MSGAWVRRARFAAADGMPMPTKQTSWLRRARAAAIVIISLGLKSAIVSLRGRRQAPRMRGVDLRAFFQHVLLDPGEERVAFARDCVPGLVVGVVALVVAVRVGR